MADKKNQPASPPNQASPNDLTLGQSIAEARERKGFSQDDVVRETHLPIHYVRMIESDNYGAISDQLYVLPFLRRYATFLDLDAEEVASRFVRDVQRSETNVTRMSEPITMVQKRRGSWRTLVIGLLVIAALGAVAELALRHFELIKQALHPSSAASSAPMPGATIETSVAPAEAPVSSPAQIASPAAQTAPMAAASAVLPSARGTSVAPQPRNETGNQEEN
ncbi:MAG TPA: helix-turn-helix domain-containing protein [Candidatus Binataceae bacterium]|nr:helix-turn-helix domain-containing protein [Candidatus Binataceae bacterium]